MTDRWMGIISNVVLLVVAVICIWKMIRAGGPRAARVLGVISGLAACVLVALSGRAPEWLVLGLVIVGVLTGGGATLIGSRSQPK